MTATINLTIKEGGFIVVKFISELKNKVKLKAICKLFRQFFRLYKYDVDVSVIYRLFSTRVEDSLIAM